MQDCVLTAYALCSLYTVKKTKKKWITVTATKNAFLCLSIIC